MRPLILDDAIKAAAERIIAYAAENHYIPGETITPGDLPEHVLVTDFGYRVVFSFTRTPEALYRDLSVSVPNEGVLSLKWPNPWAAFALADLFGFTGWDQRTLDPPPKGWHFGKDPHFHAIRICQKVKY